jgi:hypothetical protein
MRAYYTFARSNFLADSAQRGASALTSQGWGYIGQPYGIANGPWNGSDAATLAPAFGTSGVSGPSFTFDNIVASTALGGKHTISVCLWFSW